MRGRERERERERERQRRGVVGFVFFIGTNDQTHTRAIEVSESL